MSIFLPELIHTTRLLLRKPRMSDAICLFNAYTQDPDVTRYLVWRPHQRVGETEAFISYCISEWTSGRRPYVITRRESDSSPIGMLEARILPGTLDIGYVLQRSCWGLGIMPEALTHLGDLALAMPTCFRLQATCNTENHASARVLEKSGFVREARLARHTVFPNLGPEPQASLMYARSK